MKRSSRASRRRQGAFTLLELLVAIVVAGVIVGLVSFSIGGFDRGLRFEAYGWHVQRVANGLDVEAIDQAIHAARQDPRPSLIMVRNIIGYGLPTLAGTEKSHGSPPGESEWAAAKEAAGWPVEPKFHIPEDVFIEDQVTDDGDLQS